MITSGRTAPIRSRTSAASRTSSSRWRRPVTSGAAASIARPRWPARPVTNSAVSSGGLRLRVARDARTVSEPLGPRLRRVRPDLQLRLQPRRVVQRAGLDDVDVGPVLVGGVDRRAAPAAEVPLVLAAVLLADRRERLEGVALELERRARDADDDRE